MICQFLFYLNLNSIWFWIFSFQKNIIAQSRMLVSPLFHALGTQSRRQWNAIQCHHAFSCLSFDNVSKMLLASTYCFSMSCARCLFSCAHWRFNAIMPLLCQRACQGFCSRLLAWCFSVISCIVLVCEHVDDSSVMECDLLLLCQRRSVEECVSMPSCLFFVNVHVKDFALVNLRGAFQWSCALYLFACMLETAV